MYKSYFTNRGVDISMYDNYKVPNWLKKEIGNNKNISILDIGCGLGQTVFGLEKEGYTNVSGVDLSEEAVKFCKEKGLNVFFLDIREYYGKKYDFIIMSHVLEHIEKSEIIPLLKKIYSDILNDNGKLCVMVPNAQSNTDCYWAYEDFTHQYLFTSGSLLFVLREAGYNDIYFADIEGLSGSKGIKKFIKRILLCVYKFNKSFWNKVTGSAFHATSPQIYTWELKCIAKKG